MIRKTDAIVLRIRPFSQTSHIVTWLSRDHGRLDTIVKGACRPKSHFLGQYDLFSTCEILFYSRERDGLHIAKECSPVSPRPGFRVGWKRAVAASYLADLTMRTAMRGGHHHEVYDLLSSSYDFMAANTIRPPFLLWAELKFADALGLSPQLGKCASCGQRCVPSASYFFSPADGGLNCAQCVRTRGLIASSPVPPDVLAMLQRWQRSDSPVGATNTRCTQSQLLACDGILGMFLNYHLDLGIMPKSRGIAFDMICAA